MMTYGTEQVGMEQKLNPTSVWVRNVPDLVSKPFALSSNSETRGTSIETRQETRLPAGAQIRQFGRLTMPMSRNAQSFAHFRVLESWMGKVAQVANGQFTALVISDKHPEVSETAEFTFEEISEDDRSIVKVGAYSTGQLVIRSMSMVVELQLPRYDFKEYAIGRVRS